MSWCCLSTSIIGMRFASREQAEVSAYILTHTSVMGAEMRDVLGTSADDFAFDGGG